MARTFRTPRGASDREHVFYSIAVDVTTRCWNWLGTKNGGYGTNKRGQPGPAHRFSYEAFVGPIPPGLHIDHLCRNRACVNPAHLEPVTQRENILRGEGLPAILAARTHCSNGHLFRPSDGGERRCLPCRRDNQRRFRETHKGRVGVLEAI